MKLIVKNFSSDSHRIKIERNGIFLNATYLKKVNGNWEVDNFLLKTVANEEEYRTQLLSLLLKLEDLYEIDLVKMDLKIAQ